jgi:hypothetical protein
MLDIDVTSIQTAVGAISQVLKVFKQVKDLMPSGKDKQQLEDAIAEAERQLLYATQLEDHKLRNQLRLAALTERLAAHQEAYRRWHLLMANCNKQDEINKIAFDCEQWWKGNCLYLSKEAREAFHDSCIAASQRPGLIPEGSRDADLMKLARENHDIIYRTGKIIVDAVGLPPMIDESMGGGKKDA